MPMGTWARNSSVLLVALSLALTLFCSALLPRASLAAAQKGRTEAVDALVMGQGAASAGVTLQQQATNAGAIDQAVRNTAKTETSVQSEAAAPAAEGHRDGERNLLARRNADFENVDGKNDWRGYCGNPRVTHDVAHSGNASLLFPAANKKQAMFCAPKLNLPSALQCGQEYRLSMWVTTASWVRKTRPKSGIGHHR